VKISQTEARRLRRRVEELELERRQLVGVGLPPRSISLAHRKLETGDWMFGRLQTARRLGCALVCTVDDSGSLNYYAVKP
jgi:hypothetical protein